MTLRVTSRHAEDVGNGVTVEPGSDFDESTADPATVQRLQAEGKVAASSGSKSTARKTEAKG
jgi:hypothetical protein